MVGALALQHRFGAVDQTALSRPLARKTSGYRRGPLPRQSMRRVSLLRPLIGIVTLGRIRTSSFRYPHNLLES